jgi:uncharacterized protein
VPRMLLIDIHRIPPEGIDLDEALDSESVHVEQETEFALGRGGRLRGHVDLVDGTTVHVRGQLSAAAQVECGRCLERYTVPMVQELDLFYLPQEKERPAEQEEEVELSDRDVVVGYHDGQSLDLGGVVREQVFLSLPLKRLCREDCRGLCPTCGRNLNEGNCGCPAPEPPEDPRLSPLRKLFDKN